MKGRGVYGQMEGNETRTGAALMGERISDNNIAEGHEEAVLRAMFTDRSRWGQIDAYTANLKKNGWSQARIESLLNRATFRMPRR